MFILIWLFFVKITPLGIFYYFFFFFYIFKIIFITRESCFSNHFFFFAYDFFSIILIILSFIIVLVSSFFIKSYYLYFLKIIPLLTIIFSSLNILFFFIFFEISLIPILILFALISTYKERFLSLVYFFIFTSFSRIPLMIIILILLKNSINNYLFLIIMSLGNFSEIFIFFFLIRFITKLPVFRLHYWLPKAHVDAPTRRSMILARILLKLGGYRLLRLLFIIPLNNLYYLFLVLRTLRYFISSFICLRLVDYKVIVAYSSVSHMSLAFSGLILSFFSSFKRAFLIFIRHGIVSPILFFFSHILIQNMNTRDITIIKRFITHTNLSFFFFFFFL